MHATGLCPSRVARVIQVPTGLATSKKATKAKGLPVGPLGRLPSRREAGCHKGRLPLRRPPARTKSKSRWSRRKESVASMRAQFVARVPWPRPQAFRRAVRVPRRRPRAARERIGVPPGSSTCMQAVAISHNQRQLEAIRLVPAHSKHEPERNQPQSEALRGN